MRYARHGQPARQNTPTNPAGTSQAARRDKLRSPQQELHARFLRTQQCVHNTHQPNRCLPTPRNLGGTNPANQPAS
jgi:hypothetical protein